jgi:hypothetical protein
MLNDCRSFVVVVEKNLLNSLVDHEKFSVFSQLHPKIKVDSVGSSESDKKTQ